MATSKEKLAVALNNVAELKNKLSDVKGFLSACESLVAGLNIIASDIANDVNAKISEKEYLDNQLSVLNLSVKKQAEKLEQLKKNGDDELNQQKSNFEAIRVKETERLESKENELNKKIKETLDKQDILNQKISETDELKEKLEADAAKIIADRKEIEIAKNQLDVRSGLLEIAEKKNDTSLAVIKKELRGLEETSSILAKSQESCEKNLAKNEKVLSDIENAKIELNKLLTLSDAKIKEIDQSKEEIQKLEALKIECAKLKKNLDDKDANLKNYQKELEKYANKIGYKG